METKLNDSQISMWRSLIALVLADGQKHPDEVSFFDTYFEKLPLSESQKALLKNDLQNPPALADVFDKITVPRDRSQFVYLARLLFWSDGDFNKQEEAIFSRLQKDVMSKVDLKAAMKEVDAVTVQFSIAESKRKKERSWTEKFTDAIIFWEDL